MTFLLNLRFSLSVYLPCCVKLVILPPPLTNNMKWPLTSVGRGLGASVKTFPKNSDDWCLWWG